MAPVMPPASTVPVTTAQATTAGRSSATARRDLAPEPDTGYSDPGFPAAAGSPGGPVRTGAHGRYEETRAVYPDDSLPGGPGGYREERGGTYGDEPPTGVYRGDLLSQDRGGSHRQDRHGGHQDDPLPSGYAATRAGRAGMSRAAALTGRPASGGYRTDLDRRAPRRPAPRRLRRRPARRLPETPTAGTTTTRAPAATGMTRFPAATGMSRAAAPTGPTHFPAATGRTCPAGTTTTRCRRRIPGRATRRRPPGGTARRRLPGRPAHPWLPGGAAHRRLSRRSPWRLRRGADDGAIPGGAAHRRLPDRAFGSGH